MTIAGVSRQMAGMVPGECRWIGHEGIHVYCNGSHADGLYDPRRIVFRVVTASRKHDGQPWLELLAAAEIVICEVQK